MYIGHIGVALGVRGATRRVPLWVLVLAAQGCDWIDALVQRSKGANPWSHSLVSVAAVALALALVARWARLDGRGAALVGLVYASHWPLDLLTGIKASWPGGPRVGLELYDSPTVDFVLELTTLLVGWLVYLRSVEEHRRSSLVAQLLLIVLVTIQSFADLVLAFGAPR